MKLGWWLKERMGVDPASVPCLALGTDGLSPGKDALMSVSLRTGSFGKVMYMEGARPEKVEIHTGVTPAWYRERARPKDEVCAELRKLLGGSKFVVSYAVKKFTGPWLEHHLREVTFPPVLDIGDVYTALNQAVTWPDEAVSPEVFRDRLVSMAIGTTGNTFKSLLSTHAPYYATSQPGIPELELRATGLWALWQMAVSM